MTVTASTRRKAILAITLMSLTLLLPAETQAQSLQTLNDVTRGPIETATGPKVFMSDQARLTFQAAWKEFRDTHSYNLDGEFEPGSGCPDDQDTLNSFYIYLGSNRLTKTIHFKQRCGVCAGSGKVQTSPEIIAGNNNCPNCRGSGREDAANTYTFFVLPINVPPKPETPRQKQEKALRASVAKEIAELETRYATGDIAATLRLGEIYTQGYHFIPKDLPKSEPYFLKAMILGSAEGLPGYLKAREQAFKGNPNEALLLLALRTACNAPVSSSVKLELSFTDHLVARVIADRINSLISKSKLTSNDISLPYLRRLARSSELPEPILHKTAPAMNSIINEFLSNDRPPRISGTSLSKVRQAAINKSRGAFGMLGDFAHNGEGPSSSRNAQAAHIYYLLENLISGDPYALECAKAIENSVDQGTSAFFLGQYRQLLNDSTITETTLLAIDQIHVMPGTIK